MNPPKLPATPNNVVLNLAPKVFNISYMYKSETQVETHSWKGLLFQAYTVAW